MKVSSDLQQRWLQRALLVPLTAAYLIGCNSRVMVPLKGSVTAAGKPIPGAHVMMFPDDNPNGQTTSAVTGDDGTFAVSTGLDKGLPPGKYTVTITWPDPSVKATAAQAAVGFFPIGPDLLQGKYGTRATSTIKTEVTTETTVLAPFEVVIPDPPAKPPASQIPADEEPEILQAPEKPLNLAPPQ